MWVLPSTAPPAQTAFHGLSIVLGGKLEREGETVSHLNVNSCWGVHFKLGHQVLLKCQQNVLVFIPCLSVCSAIPKKNKYKGFIIITNRLIEFRNPKK